MGKEIFIEINFPDRSLSDALNWTSAVRTSFCVLFEFWKQLLLY